MLSLEGLKKAYADGYKFAWHVGYGKSFEEPPVGKEMASTKRMCQVWTTMTEPPRKKATRRGGATMMEWQLTMGLFYFLVLAIKFEIVHAM